MSVATWVFQCLERVNLQAVGEFTIPYTIILENGAIVTAYQDSVESSSSSTTTNNTNTKSSKQHHHHHGSSGGGGGGTLTTHSSSPPSTFRHIYDCTPQTVLQGLTIVDEALEMLEKNNRRANTVVAVFAERVMPKSSAVIEKNSVVSVEYLTAQQTLNLVRRGESHAFPTADFTDPDLVASLKQVIHERHMENDRGRSHNSSSLQQQQQETLPHRPRSGILQRFDMDGTAERHATGIIVTWIRHQPTTVIIPENDDERKRVEINISERENLCAIDDPFAFPYQRCVSVDGPPHLSRPVCPLPVETEIRVKRAASVILKNMNGEAQNVVKAVLLFRYHATSRKLYFLYCPFAQLKTDIMTHPPLAFAVPSQYRCAQGGRPRPRSVHIYEEDLVEQPVLSFGRVSSSQGKTLHASSHHVQGGDGDGMSPPSPHRSTVNSNPTDLSDCVDLLLQSSSSNKQRQSATQKLRAQTPSTASGTLLSTSTARPNSVDELKRQKEEDDVNVMYDRLALCVGASYPSALPPSHAAATNNSNGVATSAAGRGGGLKSHLQTNSTKKYRGQNGSADDQASRAPTLRMQLLHERMVQRALKAVERNEGVDQDTMLALGFTKKSSRRLLKLQSKVDLALPRGGTGDNNEVVSKSSTSHLHERPFHISSSCGRLSPTDKTVDVSQRFERHPSRCGVRGAGSVLSHRVIGSPLPHDGSMKSPANVGAASPSPTRRHDRRALSMSPLVVDEVISKDVKQKSPSGGSPALPPASPGSGASSPGYTAGASLTVLEHSEEALRSGRSREASWTGMEGLMGTQAGSGRTPKDLPVYRSPLPHPLDERKSGGGGGGGGGAIHNSEQSSVWSHTPREGEDISGSTLGLHHPTTTSDNTLYVLDRNCRQHYIRATTTQERLSYTVEHAVMYLLSAKPSSQAARSGGGGGSGGGGLLHSPRDGTATQQPVAAFLTPVQQQQVRLLQEATLLAAEFASSLWYHLDNIALSGSVASSLMAANRLRHGGVQCLDQLAAVFSCSIVPDALVRVETLVEGGGGRPTTPTTAHDDNPLMSQSLASGGVSAPPALSRKMDPHTGAPMVPQPEWIAARRPSSSQSSWNASSTLPGGTKLVHDEDRRDDVGTSRSESQRQSPRTATVAFEHTTEEDEQQRVQSASHEVQQEGEGHILAQLENTEQEHREEKKEEGEHKEVTVPEEDVEKGVHHHNHQQQPMDSTTAALPAVRDVTRPERTSPPSSSSSSRKGGQPSALITEGQDLVALLLPIQQSLCEFVASIAGVHVLFPRKESEGTAESKEASGLRNTLDEVLLEVDPGTSQPSTTVSKLLLPEEEIFAGWLRHCRRFMIAIIPPPTAVATSAAQSPPPNPVVKKDDLLCVFGVAQGGIPSLADASHRSSQWTLGVLRHVFLQQLQAIVFHCVGDSDTVVDDDEML